MVNFEKKKNHLSQVQVKKIKKENNIKQILMINKRVRVKQRLLNKLDEKKYI